MKKFKLLSLVLLGLIIVSCDNDDSLNPVTEPVLQNERYDLFENNDSGVSGDVVFNERQGGIIQVIVEVSGTSAGNFHPAKLRTEMFFDEDQSNLIVTLNPVNGETGLSITEFSTDDNGNSISYDDVSDLDAHVIVELSSGNSTIVAQGDVGENAFTGRTKRYNLDEKDAPGISGSVLFQERNNGEAFSTISLENTPDNGIHPAHIHMNTALETGGIIYTFTPVDGTTGMSQSNIAALDDGTAFGYSDVLDVDGYVNVHLSATDLGTIVAQGDIGQNDLTGKSKTYALNELDVPGIEGDIVFEERANGEALATISLVNTIPNAQHPAHIHANSAAVSGPIIFTFTPVDGTTGMSQTNVLALDDGTAFGYDDVLEVDGYVNVHLGPGNDLATIVAQGDIGVNEEE